MLLYKHDDKDRFYQTKGLARLSHMGRVPQLALILGGILAIILLINAIVAIIFAMGTGTFSGPFDWLRDFLQISFAIVPSAYAEAGAATSAATQDVFKQYIPAAIIVLFCICFLWSFGVVMVSADENKTKKAADFVQMLFGFLIGVVTSILGIK